MVFWFPYFYVFSGFSILFNIDYNSNVSGWLWKIGYDNNYDRKKEVLKKKLKAQTMIGKR